MARMVKVQIKQASFRCPLCEKNILGVHSITRHRQNLKKHPNDISRCDNVTKKFPLLQGIPLKKGSQQSSDESDESDFFLDNSPNAALPMIVEPMPEDLQDNALPIISEPMPEPDLQDIVRRAPYYSGTDEQLVTRTRVVDRAPSFQRCPPADMTVKQDAWRVYKLQVFRFLCTI